MSASFFVLAGSLFAKCLECGVFRRFAPELPALPSTTGAAHSLAGCSRVSYPEGKPREGVRGRRVAQAALGAVLAIGFPAVGLSQSQIDALVFTAGTTAHYGSQDYSYVLIGSPQAGLLNGKHFAVYGKAGYPTNAGTYVLRGNVVQQADVPTINSLLNQSVPLGEDLLSLSNTLNVLLRSVPGITNQSLAQKVATGLQKAVNDSAIAATLGLVSRVHPGFAMCAGQAFSEPLASITTYEVREVDPGTGAAGDVIGRVTIVPGAPVILPAPGAPYQLVGKEPTEHLRIRLRWGTADALRRLALLSYGFNLWRIPRAAAETAGYNVTPPTLAQLYGDVNFVRANNGPISVGREFLATGHGGASDLADPTTYFFTDDNGVRYGMPPFVDGAQYYYFVTARDILGRDGLVSPGTLAQACRRLPPQAPTEVKVENDLQNIPLGGGASTNQQRLLVSWHQNTNAEDLVTEYWIYRWSNPSLALTNDATPLVNRIGVVPHVPGTNVNQFLDTAPGALDQPGPTNVWYTVRAMSPGACDQLFSPNSGPAWGVLRQRSGPAAPTGAVYGSCGTPAVKFQSFGSITNDSYDLFTWHYVFTCQRRDPGIAWVQFFVTNKLSGYDAVYPLDPTYFSPENDVVQTEYSVQVTGYSSPTNDIGCVVGTFYDRVSTPAVAHLTSAPTSDQYLETVFMAGEVLETALDVDDPLVAALNGGVPTCLAPNNISVDPSGTVGLGFPVPPGTPLAIRVQENDAWVNLGAVFPDVNQVYWVSYPECLVGPPHTFRGCFTGLPVSTGDCSEHVARAAPDGPVAPVAIQFTPTPRSREYRLYRSADGGPLTLVSQGSAVYNPLFPTRRIVRRDDAMPPSASRLCYFVQTLDENGNGSPMSFLGCKDVKPAKLPRPILAEPQPAGTSANPQVSLNWFCPTSGVYRFQIKIERADKPNSGDPTGFSSALLVKMLNFNTAAHYKGLKKVRFSRRASLARFDEAHFTPPVSATFGPGPQFNLTASVAPSVPYNISIAAVDPQGHVGESSLLWKFTWVPPLVLANVPWPARPLPQFRYFFDDGFVFNDYAGAATLIRGANLDYDKRYPVGIGIGDFSKLPANVYFNINAGTTNLLTINYPTLGFWPGPNDLIFRRFSSDPSRQGDSLLPMIVYRQQVPNAAFPRVSGHVIQVTPLIEVLPCTGTFLVDSGSTVTVEDRLVCSGVVPYGLDSFQTIMLLRDQQPVLKGAAYQYWVVRMNDKREIDEVFYAGSVIIPPDL